MHSKNPFLQKEDTYVCTRACMCAHVCMQASKRVYTNVYPEVDNRSPWVWDCGALILLYTHIFSAEKLDNTNTTLTKGENYF